MKHLLSTDGLQALDAVLHLQPLLAFDFDGTLAPIVAHPGQARVPSDIARQLAQLATLFPTAVITGRSVADVAPRLGFEPTYIVGSHGAEEAGNLPPHLAAEAIEALDRLRLKVFEHSLRLNQVEVVAEDKQHCFAFHYRLAPDHELARAAIAALLEGLEPGLASFGGRCVVNVVAASAPDKGDAVATLVRRSCAGAAFFVGDDVNDEAVFDRSEPHWLTVRVGRDDPASKARFFLDNHSEVAAMLHQMLFMAGADQ
ncbi:MAG: trehalose-phosphatase [Burkholderiales bacterium]|nr:trehalose-phosphatase [Burkholderiales bacterium]